MSTMFPHMTVLTVAASLAAVSLVLALALLRETRMRYRLHLAGRLGPWSWWMVVTSTALSVCNFIPLLFFVSALAFRLQFGYSPVMVTDPQICPPQPIQGPHYPCDPLMSAVSAVNDIEFMWTLLQAAPIWFALGIVVLLVGTLARRRVSRRTKSA